MADGSVTITTTGTASAPIDAYQVGGTGGDWQQYVREAPATAVATGSWTLSTTGATGIIAADTSRRGVILINTSPTATIYARYDTTVPTTATGGYHDWLPPMSRTVIEKEWLTQAMSFIATASGDKLNIALATSA